MSFLDATKYNFNRAAKSLSLGPRMQRRLITPKREVKVELVLRGGGPVPPARDPATELRLTRRIAIVGRGLVLDLGAGSDDDDTSGG